MPPHEYDCCGQVLYIRKDNGEYVKFDGIQNMESITDPKYTEETVQLLPQHGTLTLEMRNIRLARQFRKMIRAQINRTRRMRRTYFRRKEKLRKVLMKVTGKTRAQFIKDMNRTVDALAEHKA